MAHLWKAGDLAVCVNVNARFLRYRHVYRVAEVTPSQRWSPSGSIGVGLILVDQRHPKNTSGHFAALNFRPILPAEPCFVGAMRSLKPRVEA